MDYRFNRVIRRSVCASAMALGLCGTALADADCSVKTLRGSYVFAATGFTFVEGVAQPKAIVELIDFNGDGTLSVPGATRSINGVVARTPPGGSGSYTADAGCTGTLSFNGGPAFDIYFSTDGSKVWMIQTNPNNVFQGTATRLSELRSSGN